jgi:hypothetical protein
MVFPKVHKQYLIRSINSLAYDLFLFIIHILYINNEGQFHQARKDLPTAYEICVYHSYFSITKILLVYSLLLLFLLTSVFYHVLREINRCFAIYRQRNCCILSYYDWLVDQITTENFSNNNFEKPLFAFPFFSVRL